MKKILGIVGSPRKNGNTDILVSKALEGARAEGAITNIRRLGDLSIKECDGCHVCWSGKGCAKNDDMCNLYAEVIQSDLIVLGTPVYWYGPTALMKGFIDRLVYFNGARNHGLIKGKSVILVIPFEEESMEAAVPVIDFFERCFTYLDLNMAAELVVPGVSRKGEVSKREDWLKKAFELGLIWGK
jgi:multimeric flavodoxin WrbA